MRKWFFALALGLAATGLPATASAHAEPESSNPPIGGTVTERPTEVEVTFTQEVVRQGTESALLVVDAQGNDVTAGPSEVDDLDRTIIRVPLQPDLPDGTYSVPPGRLRQPRTATPPRGRSSSPWRGATRRRPRPSRKSPQPSPRRPPKRQQPRKKRQTPTATSSETEEDDVTAASQPGYSWLAW